MDDARKRILERRARFVAAAFSTVALGCERPVPCLSAVPVDETAKGVDAGAADAGTPPANAGADASPDLGTAVPCLSVAMPYDAGADTKPSPHPCLKMPLHDAGAKPKVCLEFVD